MSENFLPNTRGARLHAIANILASQRIRSQRSLATELLKLGIEVAQPTLSRDLEDLSVTKDSSGFYIIDSTEDAPGMALNRAIKDLLISIDTTDQLCVLRTPPGGAQLLASAIDHANIPDVLGTIAGDDTVLMITRNPAAATIISSDLLGRTAK
ncbi:MAG: arginine repressor [Candidatus Nanopelagicales bacterium]